MMIAGDYSDNVIAVRITFHIINQCLSAELVQSTFKGRYLITLFNEDEQEGSKRHKIGQDQTDNSELLTKEG